MGKSFKKNTDETNKNLFRRPGENKRLKTLVHHQHRAHNKKSEEDNFIANAKTNCSHLQNSYCPYHVRNNSQPKIGSGRTNSVSHELTYREMRHTEPDICDMGVLRRSNHGEGYWDSTKGSTVDRINNILDTEKFEDGVSDKEERLRPSSNYIKSCKKQIERRGKNATFKGHNRGNKHLL